MITHSRAKINTSNENLSSDGGLVLISKYFDTINIDNLLSKINLRENRKFTKFSNCDILNLKLLNVFAGYTSQTLNAKAIEDPLFYNFTNVPSQSTFSRLFDRVDENTISSMNDIVIELANSQIQHQDTVILDVDSTNIVCNGNQEKSKHNYHYNNHGFHPLIITEHNSKQVLAAKLRPGNVHCADGVEELCDYVFNNLDLDGKKVILRADSAFSNSNKIDYYHARDMQYVVKMMQRNKQLQSEINELLNTILINDDNIIENTEYYGTLTYTTSSYGLMKIHYRSTVVKDDNSLFVFPTHQILISNIEDSAENIFKLYDMRGASENIFGELKQDFGLTKMSHHDFVKNEFEFMFSILAYNIYKTLIRVVKKKESGMTLGIFIRNYIKIAVKVVAHAREIKIRIDKSYRRIQEFNRMYQLL